MGGFLRAFARKVARHIKDEDDDSFLNRLLRSLVSLHPYGRILLLCNSGDILGARDEIRLCRRPVKLVQPVFEKVQEMVRVVEQGVASFPGLNQDCERPFRSFNGKVLMVLNSSFPSHKAGYAVRSHQILKHLKDKGIQVLAVTRPGFDSENGKGFVEIDGVKYVRLRGEERLWQGRESGYISSYGRQVAEIAEKFDASLIHAASNYPNGLAAVEAARLTGSRAVYEIRGLWHLSRSVKNPEYEDSGHYRYCKILELEAAKQADAVIAISSSLRDYLVSEGVEEKKISVIPNGVDTSYFSPIPPDQKLRDVLNLNGRIVVGFFGSITDYENIEDIVHSVAKLQDEGIPLSFLLAGAGYAQKKIVSEWRSLPQKENFHFLGHVPFSRIVSYYSIVDIFVYPRKDVPVCRLVPPLKPLEAMAMGKVVVLSDLPAMRDFVVHGVSGLTCKPDDSKLLVQALRILAADSDLRRSLGSSARKRTEERFEWNLLADAYIKKCYYQ